MNRLYTPKKNLYNFNNIVKALYNHPRFILFRWNAADIVESDGFRYYSSDQLIHLYRVKSNSWFNNIKPTDTVLDIGANIGTIAIPLASMAKRVIALEPIPRYLEELKRNAELNGITNIKCIEGCLGKDGVQYIQFHKDSITSPSYSLSSIKALIGPICPVDFLQMDCEGGEWSFEPEELEGIREIRMDVGTRWFSNDSKKLRTLLNWLRKDYKVKAYEAGPPTIHFQHTILIEASHL